MYISRDDIADYEGRFEFWDADTETAMVCEPTGYYPDFANSAYLEMVTH